MDVFEKLHSTTYTGTGVTLTFADVELLRDILGDAIDKAQGDYEAWRDRIKEYDRLRALEPEQQD